MIVGDLRLVETTFNQISFRSALADAVCIRKYPRRRRTDHLLRHIFIFEDIGDAAKCRRLPQSKERRASMSVLQIGLLLLASFFLMLALSVRF